VVLRPRSHHNAVSSGAEGGSAAMSALDAAAAQARAQMNDGPATDMKFCAIDDPTCEACQ
jgi:ribonucleoside-diphosphate reductase alpha chain